MAITGELWTSLEQINANNIRKWLYGSVLVRDWDPAGTTNLAGYTPFNTDGSLKTNLFSASNPGGPWYDLGSIDENGVDFTPRFKTVDVNIWQSRLPSRSDVDSDGEDIMVNCVETTPVVLALFNNLPISSPAGTNAVPAIGSVGQQNFSVNYSIFPQLIYRQLMIIGVDGELSDALYVAELRPRVSVTKLDKRQFQAKKPDTFGLSFGVYVDPASGYAKTALYSGPGWLQLGGAPTLALPNYVSQAPPTVNTATILPSTLAAAAPTGSGGTWTAGTYYWTITAKTAAGESTPSNEVTQTIVTTTNSVVLTWTQVTGATGYNVYRGTTSGGENVRVTSIGSGSTVTYTDTGSAGTAATAPVVNSATLPAVTGASATGATTGGTLSAATDYWVITGVNAQGETTASNEVTQTLTGTTSSCALSWSADTGVTGYRIYRGSSAGGEQYLAGYVTSGTTSFTDTGSSVNASALASSTAQLQWQQPTSYNGPFTYTITKTTGGVTTATTVASGPTASATGVVTATISDLTTSNVYTFTVKVTASDGQSNTYPVSNSITST